MLAYVFPGQGSQFAGMGCELAAAFPPARRALQEVDEALAMSLSRLCFEGPDAELTLTANAQPGIFAVSAAIEAVLREAGAPPPEIVAGHSLGEITAVYTAGGMSLGDSARLVRRRGELMQEVVAPGVGSMLALVGPTLSEAEEICRAAADDDLISVANINSPSQIVISGDKTGLARAAKIAVGLGYPRPVPLPVSSPFHCALMKPAEARFRSVLEATPLAGLRVPLVTNTDASTVSDPASVRDALIRQISSPVRWTEVVKVMRAAGVTRFVEIGPKSILAGLMRRIDREIDVIAVTSVATFESYLARASVA